MTSVAVLIEAGRKRAFASALDWPGWSRGGRDEAGALAALAAYAPRFAPVAAEAGLPFPAGEPPLDVVERVPGNASTEFGVPDRVAAADTRALDRREAGSLAALVAASWTLFDRVAAGAPAELRKGPRGGGRDRDKIVDHVLGAEAMYARRLGIRLPQPAATDLAAIAELRAAILGALAAESDGAPPVERGWPQRYAARRIAWHVLDHAWEIEDRSPA